MGADVGALRGAGARGGGYFWDFVDILGVTGGRGGGAGLLSLRQGA